MLRSVAGHDEEEKAQGYSQKISAKSPSISPSKSPPTANLFPFEKDPDLEVPSDVLDAQIGESADTVAQQLRIDADLASERNAEPSSKKEIDASSSDPSTSSMKVIDSLMSDPSTLSKTEIGPSKSDPSYPPTAASLEPNSAGPTTLRPGSVKDGEANTCVELGMEDSLLTENEVVKAKPSTPQPEKESSVLSVDGSEIMNGLDARNVHSDQKEQMQKKEANIEMTPALPRSGPVEENVAASKLKDPTNDWCARAKGLGKRLSRKGEAFTLPSGEACIKILNSVIEKNRKSWKPFVLGQFYSDPPSQGTLHNIVNGASNTVTLRCQRWRVSPFSSGFQMSQLGPG